MRTFFGMLALSTLVSAVPAQGGGACSAYGPSCGPKLRGHSIPEGPLRQLLIGFSGGFANSAGLTLIGVREARRSIPTSPCLLLTDPILAVPFVISSTGQATHAYKAPNATGLVAYFQDLNLVPRVGGGFVITSTNGLRIDVANSPTRTVSEEFTSRAQLDPELSSAVWGGGIVTTGKLGGSGKLGSFDVTVGKSLGKINGRDVYEWSTDAMSYPLEKTLHGLAFWRTKLKDPGARFLVIKDGVFEFTDFVLGAEQHMRIVGTRIPRIRVLGNTRISGVLELGIPLAPGKPLDPRQGLAGHSGGPGGARGGEGGHHALYTKVKRTNGARGGSVALPAGHPRAVKAAGTGGAGSRSHPVKQPATQTEFSTLIEWTSLRLPWVCRQTSAGGGGGSYWSPALGLHLGKGGTTAINVGPQSYELAQLRNSKKAFGPDSKGGGPFPVWFSDAELGGLYKARRSSELFLIGGSGGGGAGADLVFSQPHLTWLEFRNNPQKLVWCPGGGGGGGGGAIQLQSGGLFSLTDKAAILARGGDGLGVKWANWPTGKAHSSGGGGSGGSVLIQTTTAPALFGEINVLGGAGGISKEDTAFLSTASLGGGGGAGYIRVEAERKPEFGKFVGFKPAAHAQNVGVLRAADHDPLSAVTSLWYDTEALFRPVLMFYEIVARVDGRTRIFSDRDPWSRRAEEGQPVVFLIQSAAIHPATKVPLAEPAVWQEGRIGDLNLDPRLGNGFRFMILLDRTRTLSGFGRIEIESVKVYYRC